MSGYYCVDCLCRVCARNETADNLNIAITYPDCKGCNACSGYSIETEEDCPQGAFVPDQDFELAMEWGN